MSVIIRELVIRANINDAADKVNNESSSFAGAPNAEERDALIRECVEQVLEILEKRKKENI